MSPFLFSGEFFKGADGIGFEESEGIKLKEMAQGEEGDDGREAHSGDFDGQGNKSVKRGG